MLVLFCSFCYWYYIDEGLFVGFCLKFNFVFNGGENGMVFVYVNVCVWMLGCVVLMCNDVVWNYGFVVIFFDVEMVVSGVVVVVG